MCVYPDTVELSKFQVTTINDFLTNKLNQPSTQLNLTRFELRLLNYFNERCMTWYVKERKQEMNLDWRALPYETLRSDLVRLSVLSFASLVDNRDLPELHRIDNLLDNEDTNLSNTTILKQYVSSTQFFNQSISKLNSLISTTAKFQYNTALDIHLSSSLIYTYLCLSPLKMVPLLSLDRANPDFMSIVRGMLHTLEISAPSFIGTPLQGIHDAHYKTDNSKLPAYVLITDLKNDLPHVSDPDYPILLHAIDGFHRVLVIAVEKSYPVPLTRWLLFLKLEFYDLLYLENPLALRLLFVFSSMILVIRFFMSEEENVWLEYVTTYKNKVFSQYGQWTNPHDEALYMLAAEIQFRILQGKYMIFNNLDPIGLVGLCHLSSDSPDFTTSAPPSGLSSTVTTPGLSSFSTPDFAESLFDGLDLHDFDPPDFNSPALSL